MLRISLSKITSFLFVLVVFILTRQFPFSFLSPLMNVAVIALIVILFVSYKFTEAYKSILFYFLIFPLVISLLYSIFLTDNEIKYIFRFFIILLAVGLAYFIYVNERALKWFIYLQVFQAVILIVLYAYIIIFLSQASYIPLRHFFMNLGWGDIYTYDGIIYKIQIKGSALLLMGLILSIESDLIKRKKLVGGLLFLGVILAGNFAFIIAGTVYVLYVILRMKGFFDINRYLVKIFAFLVLTICLSPFIVNYIEKTIELKQKGSIGARNEQVVHLTKDLVETPFSLLFGKGLGNTLTSQSNSRDYSGQVYYELQIYYIINQLGLIFSVLYLVYHILIVTKKWGTNKEIIFYYLVYILYASTNPYIIDTTHFIVIIVLNSWIIYERQKSYKKQLYSCNNNIISS